MEKQFGIMHSVWHDETARRGQTHADGDREPVALERMKVETSVWQHKNVLFFSHPFHLLIKIFPNDFCAW